MPVRADPRPTVAHSTHARTAGSNPDQGADFCPYCMCCAMKVERPYHALIFHAACMDKDPKEGNGAAVPWEEDCSEQTLY